MKNNFQNTPNNFILNSIIIIGIWVISWIFTNLTLTYVSAFFGCVVATFHILRFFNGNFNPFKFLSLSSGCLFFIINLSVIVTGIFVKIFYNTNLFHFFNNYQGIKAEYYLLAIIFTLIFSLILFFFSEEKSLFYKENHILNKLKEIIHINNKTIYLIIILLIIIELFLYVSGFIGYKSLNNVNFQIGVIDPWMPYLDYIFHFHVAVTSLLIFKQKKIFNFRISLLIISSLLLLGFFFFTRGRFVFLLFFIELFFWYCFFNKGTPKPMTNIIALIVIIPLLYNLTLFNQLLRSSKNILGSDSESSLIEKVLNARELWLIKDLREINTEKTNQNLTFRSLVVTPLAFSMSLDGSQTKFLLGEGLLNNLIWTIPRIIFPNKINYPIGEDLMRKFGLSFTDTSNSIYLASYIDFWLFGILIYPLLFYLYWQFFLFIVTARNFNPLIILLILSSAFPLFFNIAESSVLGLFAFMRNTVILLVIFSIFTDNKDSDKKKGTS